MKKVRFESLRQIPILDVAEALRMDIMRNGSVWAMRGEDGPSSLVLFPGSNRWKRWSGIEKGGVSSGSVIDLYLHMKNTTDLKEAVEWLASTFPSYTK